MMGTRTGTAAFKQLMTPVGVAAGKGMEAIFGAGGKKAAEFVKGLAVGVLTQHRAALA